MRIFNSLLRPVNQAVPGVAAGEARVNPVNKVTPASSPAIMKLIAPQSFHEAPQWKRSWICNGTGSAGSPEWLVAILDSFNGWGINFRKASDIHDWQYYHGLRWYDKIIADCFFLTNMIILSTIAVFSLPLSNGIGNMVMFPLRVARAYIYFLAVLLFGWRPFYSREPEPKPPLRSSILKK